MAKLEGKVTWVGKYNKKFKNASFRLDGTEEFLRIRKLNDSIKPGYTIAVIASENDDGDYDVKKVKLIKKGKPPQKGGRGKGGGYGGNKSGPEIQWQHSQEMALMAADMLIQNEAVKLGAKTKPDARKTVILELVDELTVKFYQEVTSKAPLEKAKELEDELDDDEDDDDEDFDDEDDDDFDDEDDDDDDDMDWDD